MQTLENTAIDELREEAAVWKERFDSQQSMMEMTVEHLSEVQEELRSALEEKEKVNRHLSDSIRYAERLQSALLPSSSKFSKVFEDYFILYKPKDIVSGDFYWVFQTPSKNYLAAIDCTGHGIPGAMLTVMVNSILTNLMNMLMSPSPSELIHQLDNLIDYNLRSHDAQKGGMKDGLDISIIQQDRKSGKVLFCGAHHSLLRISEGKLFGYKGGRYSVGENSTRKGNLVDKEVNVKNGDLLYLSSDGFTDQFGSENKEKYMRGRFKKFIHRISRYPLDLQQSMLEEEFKNWKGDTVQMDDVLVIGIKLN